MGTRIGSRIPRILLISAVVALFACSGGDAAQSGDEGESVAVVPSGATLRLALDETVSTETHRAGDGVTATVTEPVTVGGAVVVPSGARLEGTIQESRRSDGPEDPAVLAFRFETLRVDGTAYPVRAEVKEAEPQRTEGDSDAESAAKVAIGTAAGAVVGQILGGSAESTLGGAAAGTLAGAAVAITSQHGHATLREGSLLTVEIQEGVRLD